MANYLYAKAREGFLTAKIDWSTATIKVALLRGYTANLSTHEFVSDVTGAGGTLAYTATLSGKTITGGVADAEDVTFSAPTGAALEMILIYQSSAVTGGTDVADSAKRVIYLGNDTSGVSLPWTPNGDDFIITWNNSPNRIFRV